MGPRLRVVVFTAERASRNWWILLKNVTVFPKALYVTRLVRAFDAGEEHAPRWENAHTIASGIRVPQAVGDFLILRAVRESGGFAIAVEDDAISAALDELARTEGFLMCPEGAATYAAYKQSLADGRVRPQERAVLFNCATGLKYPLPPVTRSIDRTKPIDFAAL